MPLLGVKGVVVIGHGRSKAPAVASAMEQATRAVESRLVESTRAGWQELTAKAN